MSAQLKSDPSVATPAKFVLEYKTAEGLTLGDDLQEYQSLLRIDHNEGTLFRETFRAPSDIAGVPIGVFSTSAPDSFFQDIQRLVGRAKLNKLPPPSGGGPGVGLLNLTYEFQEIHVCKDFPSRDFDALEQLDELLRELGDVARDLEKNATAAMRLSVSHVRGPGDGHFELLLKNIGKRALALTDPRSLAGDENEWCGVQIAEYPEETPGITSPPLQWSRLELEPPAQELPDDPHVVIEPGTTFSLPTKGWHPTSTGVRHLIQGVWSNYVGPKKFKGHYRLRGATFSDGIEIVPRRH